MDVIEVLEYLPVGSVVRLKNGRKRLVIAGIIQMEQGNESNLHDYLGYPYPEGFIGPGFNFLFDHDQIDEVIFTGYTDSERTEFLNMIEVAKRTVLEEENDAAVHSLSDGIELL